MRRILAALAAAVTLTAAPSAFASGGDTKTVFWSHDVTLSGGSYCSPVMTSAHPWVFSVTYKASPSSKLASFGTYTSTGTLAAGYAVTPGTYNLYPHMIGAGVNRKVCFVPENTSETADLTAWYYG